MSRLPTMRIWHKNAERKENTNLGAVWESEHYPNSFQVSLGSYDKDTKVTDKVVAVKLASGRVLRVGKDVGYINAALSDGLSIVNSPSPEAGNDFDDTPFRLFLLVLGMTQNCPPSLVAQR